MPSLQAPCWHVVWTDFHMNFFFYVTWKRAESKLGPRKICSCTSWLQSGMMGKLETCVVFQIHIPFFFLKKGIYTCIKHQKVLFFVTDSLVRWNYCDKVSLCTSAIITLTMLTLFHSCFLFSHLIRVWALGIAVVSWKRGNKATWIGSYVSHWRWKPNRFFFLEILLKVGIFLVWFFIFEWIELFSLLLCLYLFCREQSMWVLIY